MDGDWVKTTVVAKRFGVCRNTILKMIYDKKIPVNLVLNTGTEKRPNFRINLAEFEILQQKKK